MQNVKFEENVVQAIIIASIGPINWRTTIVRTDLSCGSVEKVQALFNKEEKSRKTRTNLHLYWQMKDHLLVMGSNDIHSS